MLKQQFQRIQAIWRQLSQNQRVAVMFVGMAAVVAVGLLLLWRPPKDYKTAFSGLTSQDAAAIVEQLDSQGVPYELSNDGTTIRVPAEVVADVRLTAASNGLPQGGAVGFELFDKSSFGITEFAQQVNYQRALEGELQRTINRIDSVASSRVHIVIPQDTLFTEDQDPTTAAVVIQFKPGGRLTDQQIKGVTHLVSSSVPGLTPENLTVIDAAGSPIWSGEEESSALAGSGDTFQMEQAYENDLSRQLQSMINQVVGPGHAAVSVSAVLNWDAKTVESETFSPDGTQPQVRSQQEMTETSTGSTTGAEGEPGTDSNTETFQEGTTDATAEQHSSNSTTTNYELSRRVEHVVEAPGKVERLSVAVVMNQNEVDPVVAQQIQDVITAAAGIDAARGDTISVTAVPFNDTAADEFAATGPGMLAKVLDVLKVLGIILIPIAALLIARRTLLQSKRDLVPALAGSYQMAPGPRSQSQNRVVMTEVPPNQAQATIPVAITPRQQSNAQKEVLALADADPSQVAHLIRMWMNEEQ
jgi:flagellar M-ring protein FliF